MEFQKPLALATNTLYTLGIYEELSLTLVFGTTIIQIGNLEIAGNKLKLYSTR